MRYVAVALTALLLGCSGAQAESLKKGTPAPKFSGLESTTGKKISSDDFGADALVIAITCNHCPVAKAYEDRLIALDEKYGDKLDVVAINVNNSESDKLPAMKVRAEEKGFKFPYAYDPSQQIAKDLKAKKTPEFFVFDKDRKLVYTGAFDDNMDANQVSKPLVEEAVIAVLEGKEPPASTSPQGCGIRYEQ